MARAPEYDVAVRHDVAVPTRDGVDLATDVYRPVDRDTGDPIDDPLPALLYRTPYDKRARATVEQQGRYYATRGYVVALQDVRGRYGSEGEFYLLKNEAEDGADAVEWLADEPYTNGEVGTMGLSYMAWVQSALATQDPDGLAAMFVTQGAASAWEATLRQHGAFELRWLTWALTRGAFDPAALDDVVTGESGDPSIQRRLAEVDTGDLLAEWPLVEGQSPLRHVPDYEEWVFDFMTTPGDSEFWDDPSINFRAHYDEMADVPTVYAGSWYDSYAKATCDNFAALSERMERDQYLVMGPWTHGGQRTWTRSFSGEVDFGEAAVTDYLEKRLDFFDHYLKGRDTWADQPPVEYFRMGVRDGGAGAEADHDTGVTTGDAGPRGTTDGRLHHGGAWAEGDAWPLPDTEFATFYAHGDGSLSRDPPGEDGGSTSYEFDPLDPVPTVGGNCSSYYSFEQRDERVEEYSLADRHMRSITGHGGYDQRTREWTVGDGPHAPLEERDDVLVFRTPPLSEPVEIAGPIRVTVFGETDGPDTDFTAKLVDEYPASEEYPDGFSLNLADGICRGRYRGWRRDADLLTPGEVYEFPVEPYPTANRFGVGHRIRLDVSSSNFPRFDVNPNTEAVPGRTREFRVATNTVHHDAERPTQVELPLRSV